MNDALKKFLSGKNLLYIAAAALGVLMILLGSVIKPGRTKTVEHTFDEKAYVSELETRLCDMLSKIRGAGDCSVMINISSTTESVYVKESRRSTSNASDNNKSETEDNVLTMKDGDGNEYALVKKQIMPKISGVSIVSKGASDPTVKAMLIDAVCTVLDISSNKVCVIAKAN